MGIQSKALDKSVKTAPATLLLSDLFLQSFKNLVRTRSVLKDLRYAEINGEFTIVTIYNLQCLSQFFHKFLKRYLKR